MSVCVCEIMIMKSEWKPFTIFTVTAEQLNSLHSKTLVSNWCECTEAKKEHRNHKFTNTVHSSSVRTNCRMKTLESTESRKKCKISIEKCSANILLTAEPNVITCGYLYEHLCDVIFINGWIKWITVAANDKR